MARPSLDLFAFGSPMGRPDRLIDVRAKDQKHIKCFSERIGNWNN